MRQQIADSHAFRCVAVFLKIHGIVIIGEIYYTVKSRCQSQKFIKAGEAEKLWILIS